MVRYYILPPFSTTGSVEVFPLNDSDLKINYEFNDDNYLWDFREKLSDTIFLQRDDSNLWSLFKLFESNDNRFFLYIKRYCNGSWNIIFTGYFNILDCEFDNDQCTIKINIHTSDTYYYLLKKIEKDYNLIDEISQKVSVFYEPVPNQAATVHYKTGMLLSDILDFFAGEFSLTYKSDFFVNGDPVAGFNLEWITMHDLADVKHPNYTPPLYQPTTIAYLSFYRLMAILNGMFDVFWYIDGNYLRIEHRLFFLNGKSYTGTTGVGIDLTLPEFRVTKTDKYKYLSQDMPWREEWEYQEHSNDDARGWIEYDDDKTGSNKINTRVLAITDIYDIWTQQGSYYSDDGWVLMRPDYHNPLLPFQYSILGVGANGNILFKWLYLLLYYHTYDRVLIEGYLNDISYPIVWDSVRDNRESPPISFQYCCGDFDPLKLITTDVGNGRVREASKRLKDELFEIILRYEPI